MTEQTTDALVDEIGSLLGDAPRLHELDSDETAALKIQYVKSNRRDFEGFAISFHFGSAPGEIVERLEELIEPRLDKRKFKIPTEGVPRYKQNKSWTIGVVEVDNDGEIVDYTLNREYLKPTEQ